ncbi:DUF1488 family protein [Caldimonas tepidiphila]|uniref:DUF1488 family protein n=1 Tax=Caldimonas tepidiphila TaxID=2315841 RepID=UPI00130070D9|nr:DUF1488 family protein [Caldimonas tepidiphila]
MDDRVRLCPVVQGVQFTVEDGATTLRCLILRDALETRFGADASPDSWLRAYVAHADVIDAAALLQHRLRPGEPVVVLSAEPPRDFRHIQGDAA